MKKIKNLRAGEIFTYNDIEFVALGQEQGGLLAVAVEPLKNIPFDKNNRNDWRISSLRKYLNEEYIKKFPDSNVLMPFESDLTSDDGMINYGISYDKVFLLSANLYRKYRYWLPQWKTWVWLITPESCLEEYACYERTVNTDGSLYYNDASVGIGAAPALLFNLNLYIEDSSKQVDSEIKKLKDEIAAQKDLLESLNTKVTQLQTKINKIIV